MTVVRGLLVTFSFLFLAACAGGPAYENTLESFYPCGGKKRVAAGPIAVGQKECAVMPRVAHALLRSSVFLKDEKLGGMAVRYFACDRLKLGSLPYCPVTRLVIRDGVIVDVANVNRIGDLSDEDFALINVRVAERFLNKR